jgi:hypothetical protein
MSARTECGPPILLVFVFLRSCLGLFLGGYFDIHGMNVVGLLRVERDNCEIAAAVPRLNASRLPRSGRTGLHGIKSLGGDL